MSSRTLNPTAPNKILWLIAVILGILGIIGMATTIDGVSQYADTLILVAFVLLAIGTTFKGI